MEKENGKAFVGRCGLYCAACCLYRAERDSPQLARRLADQWNVPLEKIHCTGCGDLDSTSWGIECEIVSCQRDKGYNYCFECPDFETNSCANYRKLSEAYLEEDGVDMRASMFLIMEGRVDEWLEESRKKYTCPNCGKPLIAGRHTCHHCHQVVK